MKKYVPVGAHHTILKQSVFDKPNRAVPVLYLRLSDNSVCMHERFHEFMLANCDKSMTWKMTHARAIGLFWDFTRSHKGSQTNWQPINIHKTVIRAFCEALRFGTINPETGVDLNGLNWPSTNYIRAKDLIRGLEDVSRWAWNESAGTTNEFSIFSLKNLQKPELNAYPSDEPTAMRFLLVARYLKEISFMAHLKNENNEAKELQAKAQANIYDFGSNPINSFDDDPAVYMKSEIIAAFMDYGFIKNATSNIPWVREDLTAKMLFTTMAFGGCRPSEPHHQWFNDVILTSGGGCKMFLRHPAEAKTYFAEEKCNRRDYLAVRGILPRNIDTNKSAHAGWKSLAVDKQMTAPVFWLHDAAEQLFAAMYRNYLVYRGMMIEQRLDRGQCDHPFLYVSAGENRNDEISNIGDPYSMGAFCKAWDKALIRVSKILGYEIERRKELGTTPQACRHFYGQVLADAATDQKVIQKALRHRSVLSQATYTKPDFDKVNRILQEARTKISAGYTPSINFTAINNALQATSYSLNYK